ncbi:sensor histidine kinase [Maledivibacter halophilus]|uniref:histidine kinase n=1 Tax=Maledivibacter halophilus TaxID=36842 RepID=A0A1T5JFL1_9FIRM|nr:ATP-binding protein [Maledivibacter halophilus]SKC50022.1 Histidine kinase-, DNA gyrase B-, and HSP90-like ATPase [Maledivibacter halophilus]
MRKNININIEKTAIIIYIVNITQMLILLSFIIYSFIFRDRAGKFISENLELLFLILIAIILINSYIALRDINALKILNDRYFMQCKTLNQIEDLNNILRSQRHDFLNHLQVVYSLIEMNEYKETSNYIEKVYEDIKKINKVLKTSSPAINGLLQAKQLDCEDRGILVELKIETRLDKLKVPSWEMCRVLGNIIDNAIEATEENRNKYIKIEIFEESHEYKFLIKNNGKKIPENLINKIFEPGFTTKGEKGQGMGLAISKEIIEKYGGDITVSTNQTDTTFEIIIPFD